MCAQKETAIQNKSKAIGNGAQVNQLFNRNGFPPLMLASYDGYAEVVDVLLGSGAIKYQLAG